MLETNKGSVENGLTKSNEWLQNEQRMIKDFEVLNIQKIKASAAQRLLVNQQKRNQDKLGNLAKKILKKYKVNLNPIYEHDRPTTEKSIYISKDHNLLKVNNVSNQPISNISLDKIKKKLKKNNYDILIIADYRH